MATTAAVVLAAGKGTRMRSVLPKVLHQICGKSMLQLVAEAINRAGVGPTLVVVPIEATSIRSVLGTSVSYAVQNEPLGSGDALKQARSTLKDVDHIAVLHGDVPLIRSETLVAMKKIHEDRNAAVTILTGIPQFADGLGRVLRNDSGDIESIVEYRDADDKIRQIREINGGIYWFRSDWLWDNLDRVDSSIDGEVELPDLVRIASSQREIIADVSSDWSDEVIGVNTRVHLAQAEEAMRQSMLDKWMIAGVTIRDTSSVYLDCDVQIGEDTILNPNTHLTGTTVVGSGCVIGPNSSVHDSEIGSGCTIMSSIVTGSTLRDNVEVGPFSHIRPGSSLGQNVKIGSFGEVNRSSLGNGTTSAHYSYLGDAEIGDNVNIGAGTVTCNFDGKRKHRTKIGDNVFIGSSSMIVAPVTIGSGSVTGAGCVVIQDVLPNSRVVGVPARAISDKDTS